MNDFPDSLWSAFRCGYCGSSLEKTAAGAECQRCATVYPYTDHDSLDLRLQRTKHYALEFNVRDPLVPSGATSFMPLSHNPRPEVEFTGMAVPHHLTAELLSHFPRAQSKNSMALDLGCGAGIHRAVCEHAGFQWVGLDYGEIGAPIWGDAHSLPFADESFEFILTIAVLEHIQYPFIMMREAERVLKPGGRVIGTVAFLEPFHGNSYYHHSHLGTLNVLQYAGFEVQAVAPQKAWMVLRAQASMGLFPRMPAKASGLIVAPVELLHRLWWRLAGLVSPDATEETRLPKTAGSFTFIATKPKS